MNIETANRLIRYRKQKGFSQEELAERIGVSRQAVSKWERAEASPDTDNLIALADVYGVTLDELLKREPATESEPEAEPPRDKVDIGLHGVHVEDRNGDKVHIDWRGVHVDSPRENAHVHIGAEDVFHFREKYPKPEKTSLHKFFNHFPYPVLCVIAYLAFGAAGVCGGWGYGWLIFLTIPLYYSLVSAIFRRNAEHFAYPVLVAFVYLWIGFAVGLWHPMWILFLTIPLYYFICNLFKKG